jgi:hypothetical protein
VRREGAWGVYPASRELHGRPTEKIFLPLIEFMLLPERNIRNPERKSLISRISEIILGKKETDYIRFSADGTRKIHLWWDRDCEVSRAGMFAVSPFNKADKWDDRIFEIARIGNPGEYRFYINIESVATDSSRDVIKFSHYDESGILQISGGSFVYKDEDPSESRARDIQRGHMLTSHLPHRIHFGETVKRFLLNAVSENPSFDSPELVPYDVSLDTGRQSKEFVTTTLPQLK